MFDPFSTLFSSPHPRHNTFDVNYFIEDRFSVKNDVILCLLKTTKMRGLLSFPVGLLSLVPLPGNACTSSKDGVVFGTREAVN